MFIVSFVDISKKTIGASCQKIYSVEMKHGNIHTAPMELWFIVTSINMPPITGFTLILIEPQKQAGSMWYS